MHDDPRVGLEMIAAAARRRPPETHLPPPPPILVSLEAWDWFKAGFFGGLGLFVAWICIAVIPVLAMVLLGYYTSKMP